jgi:hypothetical protein
MEVWKVVLHPSIYVKVSFFGKEIEIIQDGSQGKIYKAANYTHVGNFIEPSKHIEAIMLALLQVLSPIIIILIL